jgi:protein SCO1/2
MPRFDRRKWLALSGTALLAGAVPAAAAGKDVGSKPLTPREKVRQRYFPNVELTTHEGKKVRFYDDLLKDKIVLINFMYAECTGVCPGITANLKKVQNLIGKRMGKDVFIYSFTLQPQRDTPQVLNHYAKMHKVAPGWLFLTGSPADMEMLRRKLGFTDPDPERDKDKANHIGNIRYGNEALTVWSACPGLSKASAIADAISWVDWPKDDKPAAGGKGGRK